MKSVPSFFKKLPDALFNFFARMFLRLSNKNIELLRQTQLFNSFKQDDFSNIIEKSRIFKYRKNKIIFKEGDHPDALYIILEGSVRVFAHDINGKKIALARLTVGDYFGEQALLGQSSKTRNANTEAIDNSLLIKIDADLVKPLWQGDINLKSKLKKVGYEQAVKILHKSIKQLQHITPILKKLLQTKHEIIEFSEGKVIFNLGDKPDYVYFILQGEVELLFDYKPGESVPSLTLHKGHLFGELGVLENKPRQATAIAYRTAKLLAIEAEDFKKVFHLNPTLQQYLARLKHTYELPLGGVTEQYLGSNEQLGSTLTNVFKMDDGRTIISILSLDENTFTMSVANVNATKTFRYVSKNDITELGITNNRLVEIKSSADWDDLPFACKTVIDNKAVEESWIQNFTKTGEFKDPTIIVSEDPIICACMSVTQSQLQTAISRGATDFNALSRVTGACTVCRGCRYKLLELLGQDPWGEAIMQEVTQHNPDIKSYVITLTSDQMRESFKNFLPGQHVVLQVKVNENWVERVYTLSDIKTDNKKLRVTIRRQPKGALSDWLFTQAPKRFAIKITKPQGEFILHTENNTAAICFAGGVGITPFIAYAKSLELNHLNKKLHIVYCARSKNDFIFMDEFKEIMQHQPTVSLHYREDVKSGFISKDDIIKIIKPFKNPEIYICGSERFNDAIYKIFVELNYPEDKIYIEKFLHAGS